jgi:hypothetical protein
MLDAFASLRLDVRIKIFAGWDTVSAIALPPGFWSEEYSFVNEQVPTNVDHAFLLSP